MIPIAQVQEGIVKFIDTEIVPKLSLTEKIVIGAGSGLVAAKLPDVLSAYPIIATLGIYDAERQEIDIDTLHNAVKPYIGADPVPITIPVVGVTLKMGQREFERLYRCLKEA